MNSANHCSNDDGNADCNVDGDDDPRGPRFHLSGPDPPPGLLAVTGSSLRPTLGRPLGIGV